MLGYLTDNVIHHLLTSQRFGRLACAVNDEISLVPVNCLFDGQFVYIHTREGTKTRLIRQNPSVCFEVDELLSPSLWRSVVVRGVAEELTGDDRLWALQRLGVRQLPLFSDETPLTDENPSEATEPHPLPATVLYRIHIQSKTGRHIQR
ncbi:pyridoxamine 5'-phosphate oxidase family protein [Spirosoma koreense]